MTLNKEQLLNRGVSDLSLINDWLLVPNNPEYVAQVFTFATLNRLFGYLSLYDSGKINKEVLNHYLEIHENIFNPEAVISDIKSHNSDKIDGGFFLINITNAGVLISFHDGEYNISEISKYMSVTEFEDIDDEQLYKNDELLEDYINKFHEIILELDMSDYYIHPSSGSLMN